MGAVLSVALRQIRIDDCAALLQFETENKSYFEQFVPPRPVGFLTELGMIEAVEALLGEMESGAGMYYLLWRGHKIVGRFNFSRCGTGVAELGYRIGANQTGKGMATLGLELALNAVKLSLARTRIVGETTPDNLASMRVMEKCGFVKSGVKRSAAVLHGRNVDLLGFEKSI